MDVIKFRAFCTVASLGSISKAAERLNYTQPAISAQIRELEHELKARLFERVGRHVRLTEAGRMLQPHADRLLRDFDECRRSMPRPKDSLGGYIRIGASSLPGVHLLPGLLAEFRKRIPDISFNVTVQSAYQIERLLFDNQIDVGFLGRRNPNRKNSRVAEHPLIKDDLVAIVPPGHPWSEKTEVGLVDFPDEPLILPPRNILTRRSVEEKFRRAGVEMNLAFEVGNAEAIKRMVSCGLGVSIICSCAVSKEVESKWLASVPLSGLRMPRYISLVTNREQEAQPDLRAFIDFVLSLYPGKEFL